MTKKEVRYYDVFVGPEVGKQALLSGVEGHPTVANGTAVGRIVYTSTVVRVGEGGEFETLNSVYRPIA